MSIGLWLLSLLVLASAVLVVSLSNLFRAALSLGLVLVGVAGLFLLLEAEFLAFVQILVYVGAILTLVVFAIMLTVRLRGSAISRPTPKQIPAALVSLALFILLTTATRSLAPALTPAQEAVTLRQLGQELVTTLVLPFEVISVVFVAAMVGAIAIASSKAQGQTAPTRQPTVYS